MTPSERRISSNDPTGLVFIPLLFTVRVNVVVLVNDPPVPVTVIVADPTLARAVAVRVKVVVHVGLQDVGEKEADTPDGKPDAE